MNALSVRHKVLEDIGSRHTNERGWDFREHLLLEPESNKYKEADGSSHSYWCVLREPNDGYHIIYDEEAEMFGLATSGVAVGWYGSFMDAINGM